VTVTTLAVTEAGPLWLWGSGAHGGLGHGDKIKRLRVIPTCLDAQQFDGTKIVTAAAQDTFYSTAVTAVTETTHLSSLRRRRCPSDTGRGNDLYAPDVAIGHDDMQTPVLTVTLVTPLFVSNFKLSCEFFTT
jgi:hypothetical protein